MTPLWEGGSYDAAAVGGPERGRRGAKNTVLRNAFSEWGWDAVS